MADLKRTVAVRPIATTKMGGPNGRIFDKAFQKHMRKTLQKAGYLPPDKGKSLYAITGHVQAFSHTNGNVTVSLWCNAEKNDEMQPEWGTSKSKGTAPGIKTQKDMQWGLDALAAKFAPEILAMFKARFR